ncbi:MAG: SpoIVB peptidase [Clostridia bacterium]|nr:SpoIVB peptidase [Clostridia bacterium]
MKRIKQILLIIFLSILLAYVTNIDTIPENIILFEGEKLNISTLFGVRIEKQDELPISSSVNSKQVNYVKKENYEVSILDRFKVKTVEANIIPNTKVIPIGETIGLKLHTKGVLVVGMSEVKNINNEKVKAYVNSNIEEGDMIIEANGVPIASTADLVQTVNSSNGEDINIKYIRDNNEFEESFTPIQISNSEYKLGLWVRDTEAGIGTISFYEPSTKSFAALGHGILDIDTKSLISIANGEITTANILSIAKGERGIPGEIRGSLIGQTAIGTIAKNTSIGIYGVLNNLGYFNLKNGEVDIAMRDEIKIGKATMICSLENNQKKEYEVEIQKIYINNNSDNKSMVIKITDKELLEKTGGIIQGMSGSPILQNGKLIGALTHVLVSDPSKGYAIFADMMIKQMRET